MVTVATSAEAMRKPAPPAAPSAGPRSGSSTRGPALPPGDIGRAFVRSRQTRLFPITAAARAIAGHRARRPYLLATWPCPIRGNLFLCDRRRTGHLGGANIYPPRSSSPCCACPACWTARVRGSGSRVWRGLTPSSSRCPAMPAVRGGLPRGAGHGSPATKVRAASRCSRTAPRPNGKIARRRQREPYRAGRQRGI